MECRVRILLGEIAGPAAEAVALALGPDNVDFPEGLSLEISEGEGGLIIDFRSTGGMGPLIASVDEVLEHATVSLKVTGSC